MGERYYLDCAEVKVHYKSHEWAEFELSEQDSISLQNHQANRDAMVYKLFQRDARTYPSGLIDISPPSPGLIYHED